MALASGLSSSRLVRALGDRKVVFFFETTRARPGHARASGRSLRPEPSSFSRSRSCSMVASGDDAKHSKWCIQQISYRICGDSGDCCLCLSAGNTDFRDGLTDRGLRYAVGIQETTTVWPPGRDHCRHNRGAQEARDRNRFASSRAPG